MPGQGAARWIGYCLLARPVYGLPTFAATLAHQPDPSTGFEAYDRYVSTAALGSYLANWRVGRWRCSWDRVERPAPVLC